MAKELLNFNRIERCRQFWQNEHGHVRKEKPVFETCCNDKIPDDMLEKYRSRQRVDVWQLVTRMYFTIYDWVDFTGNEGEKYRSAYAAHLFTKSKKVKRSDVAEAR
jgi:hypothetical protein